LIRFALLFLLLFPVSVFSSNPLIDLYNFFPKASHLSGGNKKWLYTSIKEERFENYVVLQNSYSYFSEKGETIAGIQKKANFTVNISLYYGKNREVAKSIYENLILKSKMPVKRAAEFGEESVILLKPISLQKIQAEYNILILNKNFVVDIKTDDGFALMEFADYFDKSVKAYMLANIDRFFLDRFRVKVEYGGFTDLKEIVSINSDASMITIKGKVVDGKNRPIFNAKVSLLEYSTYTVTDEEGEYKFLIKTKNVNGKSVEFVKNFIIDKTLNVEDYDEKGLIAKLTLTYTNRKEEGILKIDKDFLYGNFVTENRIDKIVNIKKDGEVITFVRDCSLSGSAFKCLQNITVLKEGDKLLGNFIGFGGKGTIEGEIYSDISQVSYFVDKDFSLQKITTDKNLNIIGQNYQDLFLQNMDSRSDFIHFKNKNIKKSPLDIEYQLKLIKFPSRKERDKTTLYIFEGEIRDNKLNLILKDRKDILESDEPVTYYFPIDDIDKEYFIGFLTENKRFENLFFSYEKNILELSPQIVVKRISINQSEAVKVNIKKGDIDLASTSKGVNGDNRADLLVEITGIDGNITEINAILSGKYSYEWSTDKNKIFPNPIVKIDGKIVTKPDGTVDVNVSKADKIYLYFGYPVWVDVNNADLTISIEVDKKRVELNKNIGILE